MTTLEATAYDPTNPQALSTIGERRPATSALAGRDR
jgi:hypothetical protein